MRHHFHRCGSLRIVSIPASELHGARRGGSVVVEELCDARKLTPCVGLAECELLSAGQKQELLVDRATRIRDREGRPTALSGVSKERAAELEPLRRALGNEREAIVEENLRLAAEIGGAEDRELEAEPARDADLTAAGLSIRSDSASSLLRTERLDAIDRALAAMEDPAYGTCGLCGGAIAVERLRLDPGTRVCMRCAEEAPSPPPISARD